MKQKYAVALLKGGCETILGVFGTKKEADDFGNGARIPKEAGLHYCFSAPFSDGKPIGNKIRIYDYYNTRQD